jgi:hypothetical protein
MRPGASACGCQSGGAGGPQPGRPPLRRVGIVTRATTTKVVYPGGHRPYELESGLPPDFRPRPQVELRGLPRECEFPLAPLQGDRRPATALQTAKWLVVACANDFVPPEAALIAQPFDPGDDLRALDPGLLFELSYRFRCAGRWYDEQGFGFASLQTISGRAALAELARQDRSYSAGVFDPVGAIESPTGACFGEVAPRPGAPFRQARLWGRIDPNATYVVVQVRPWRGQRASPVDPIKVTVDASYNPDKARIFVSSAIDPVEPDRFVDLAAGRRFDAVHELFHAIQFHLAPAFMSWTNGRDEYHWVEEGMAGATTMRLRMLQGGLTAQRTVELAQLQNQGHEGIRRRDWGVPLNGRPPQRGAHWAQADRYQARSGGGIVFFCVRDDQSIGYLMPMLGALEREAATWRAGRAPPSSYALMHRMLADHASSLAARPASLTGLKAAYIRAIVVSGQYDTPPGLGNEAARAWRRAGGCGGSIGQIPARQPSFTNDLAPFESRCAAFQSTNRNEPRLRFVRTEMPPQSSVYSLLQAQSSSGWDGLVVSNEAIVDAPGAAGEVVQFNICRLDENAPADGPVAASTQVSPRR